MDLVVLIGLQASGKSSFYRERLGAGHALVSKDLMPNVRDRRSRQRAQIAEHLGAGRSVAVDNTNPALADRAELVALARAHGARVVGYYFDTPVRACLDRNTKREGKARVPPAALFATARRMVVPSRSEGFDELYRVYLVEGGFDVVPFDVATA